MTETVQTPELTGTGDSALRTPHSALAEAPLLTVPDVLPATHYALQPHPLVPLPTAAEAAQFMARPGGDVELTKLLNDRGQLIWLMKQDPAHYGAELEHWRAADAALAEFSLVYVSGGKRAGKSEWAAKRFAESCETYGDGKRWAFQDNITTSIATQQQLFWRYLSPETRGLNGKKTDSYKIKYSRDGGFTNNMLVLPNGTEVYFLTYNQEPTDFQGWELGSIVREWKFAKDGRRIENIGGWPDENLTVKWLETLKYRLSTRGAKMPWTFSTTEGITNTIKAFLGTPLTLESRPAELLADRVNLPGLPRGHMPFIQQPNVPSARVVYFFTQWNPFSGYAEPGGVKELCAGKDSAYIMMNAYGYAEEVGLRKFPKFGSWNIIQPQHLPAEGTNYHAVDPHGAWNWASLYVRVAPGNPASLYFYRDWPDYKRFGEWAVPSDSPTSMDGDKGPAQKRSLGYGPADYKALFLREERITDASIEKDPYRLRMLAEAEDGTEAREKIFARYIDPRAGKNQHAVDKGGVCLIDKLAQIDRDGDGAIRAPGLEFIPAPGLHIADGEAQINDWLRWDLDKPMIPLINEPHLYVCSDCKQLIWALQNWTGEDGQEGACKAWIDLVRYLVTAGIRYITPGRVRTSGGGSY